MCQTAVVCEPISRTQTSVPFTRAKPLPKANATGIKRSCLFAAQSNTEASPFPSLRAHSEHEGTNMKRKPNCAPGGTLSKTRLASCSILAGYWRDPLANAGGPLRLDTGRILGRTHRQATLDRETRRDPLAACSGGILGGIHWQATLAGYSAGSTGEPLWDPQRDTRRDPLASRSGGMLGGIHWPAALAGRSGGILGLTGEQLWRDIWRDPREQLWRDTRRDPLASCSGGILGGGAV